MFHSQDRISRLNDENSWLKKNIDASRSESLKSSANSPKGSKVTLWVIWLFTSLLSLICQVIQFIYYIGFLVFTTARLINFTTRTQPKIRSLFEIFNPFIKRVNLMNPGLGLKILTWTQPAYLLSFCMDNWFSVVLLINLLLAMLI